MLVRQCSREEDTVRLGSDLGRRLEWPALVLLEGPLGSGKTVLVRGLARGLQVTDPSLVRSPSFTLINEYPTDRGLVYHIDLYRLESRRDFESIGLEDILCEHAVVIVEWAEKMPGEVENPIRVRVEVGPGAQGRIFHIEGIDSL